MMAITTGDPDGAGPRQARLLELDAMNPPLRPGNRVWRIGDRSRAPLSCIVVRPVPLGLVEVRSSTFARNTLRVRAEDVFSDREACRAEINRRAEGTGAQA